MKTTNVITRSAVLASLAIALAAPAAAGLLVYEGFDCAGAGGSALQGQAGATSIGFDAASTWGTPVGTVTAPQTRDDIARYNTTGLFIGSGATSLQVVGGSMTLTHLPHASRYHISRALDVAVTGGETVYGAYLMNYVTRSASHGRVSVDNPASANDPSRFHFGGGFGQWSNSSTIGHIPGVGTTSVSGMTGNNPAGPNLTGTNIGLGTTAITLFSITNVGGSSGSSLMWQYVLNSAQFDHFKAGGLTESELQGAALGTNATQVLQRASSTLAAPNPYPQWGLSDVLTFWWADKSSLEVIKLDEIRLATGPNGLDDVTPVLFTKRKLLVCAISYSNDDPPYPADETLALWRDLYFSTTAGQESVHNYYMENTYGAIGWTGDVIRTPIACASTTLDYQLWRTQAKATALALGYDPAAYDNVQYIFASYGGAVGAGFQPGWESWVNRSPMGNAREAIRHELGHNLGMGHAGTQWNNTENWFAYGDNSDFMGNGKGGHNNGPRKVDMGWVTATTVTSSGTYQISPLEYAPASVPHPQVLTIPSASVYGIIDGWPYYFSYRQAVDSDQVLASRFPQVVQGLSIHRWNEGTTDKRTALIATLTDGETFTDSQTNLTVQQISHDSNSVTISVTTPGGDPGSYWNGGGTDALWSNPANWNSVIPSAGDILRFVTTGAGGAVLANNIVGGSYASLQFETNNHAYTLNGNSVTLTGDPNGDIVLNNVASTQTLNLPITLTAAANLNAAAGSLVIGSACTITNGGFDLTVKGANAVTLNGAFSGSGGVIKSGTSTVTLTNNNTYTGATTVSGGTLLLNGGSMANTSITANRLAAGSNPTLKINGSYTAGSTATAAAGASVTLQEGTTASPVAAALTMVDNTVGTFTINQGSSFASAGLTIGAATATGYVKPALSFDIGGTSVTDIDKIVVVNSGGAGKGLVTAGAGGATINITALSGKTSLAIGDYTIITGASAAAEKLDTYLTLGSSTITVGSNTYNLSLANSTTTSVILSVTISPGLLLVYEGFDCAGANQSALQGQAGATSIGFDAASTWGTPVGTIVAPETRDDIARYNTTGLAIGSGATTLKVAGGSMTLTHLPHASRYYISRALDVALTGGQTVYGAYLMNYVTRNASSGRVSVDNPAGNDASRYHFGGGFGQWNNANTIGHISGVGNTSVSGTGTNGGGPNLTGTNVGLGTNALTLFSITNVGGSSGSVVMWQYVLNSAQFDNFKVGGLTESELQGAALGTNATQVLQRASSTLAAPNPYPQWGLSDVLTFWWADKDKSEVIKLDEIRIGNSLEVVTPLAAPPGGYASWATPNGLSANSADDSNHDGVANGLAYFMNVTGLATNPAINSSGQVTWPNGGNIPSSAYGSEFVVQTSSDLQTWTDVVGTGPSADPNLSNIAGSVSYSLTGASPRFVRLKVTPN